jgi:hypothetical protein
VIETISPIVAPGGMNRSAIGDADITAKPLAGLKVDSSILRAAFEPTGGDD